ncbi:MAG: homoserine dehydrogenase [Phototrophicales bacterium]|nr:MAG: homoserine dehydrogenase [Phototrophicales bacterium]
MDIALIGFGTVGQAFAQLLHDKADDLRDRYAFIPRLVAVITQQRGALYDPNGLNIPDLLASMRDYDTLAHYPRTDTLEYGWTAQKIAMQSTAQVIVEASPSNLNTGQPALDLCFAALDAKKHIVLANKGPVSVAYPELMARADANGCLVRFESTVMAGTPSIRLAMNALRGSQITAVKGILNGTTNYMLTQMETGMAYAEALAEAQRLGYAETNPDGDVLGWDAAGKAIILASALFGIKLKMSELSVKGITDITPEMITQAQQDGERWKLIAEITPTGASVAPKRLPITHPLANVGGTTNAITYTTDVLGDVTLIGAGAGGTQTAYGMLSDLIEIFEIQN